MRKKRLGKKRRLLRWVWFMVCCLAGPALATTMMSADFTCALCGQKFADQMIYSTSRSGVDSEFRPHYLGMPPLPYFVHTCPHCHYTDYNHRTPLAEQEKPNVKAALQKYCRKHDCTRLRPSQKYEILATVGEARGLPPFKIADAFLKAAWMADDEHDPEGAKRFREQAIRYFTQALAGKEIEAEIRPNLTYLVGELYRRTDNFPEALKWFDRVKDPQPWLAALVKQQRQLASQQKADRAEMPPQKE